MKHQTGILEDIYDEYGPGGEDKVMVFMIEADPGTTQPCIYGPSGCSGGSIGDWTDGVTYPILNPGSSEAATVNSDFRINYYPTLYGVAPNGDIYEVGQAGFSTWESWVAESFQMHNTTWETNEEECTTSFVNLNLVGGHGQVDYQWSHGATTKDLYNIPPGDYYVTISDDNNYQVVKGPIEIEFNDGGELALMDLGHIDCNGDAEGFIEVEMVQGSGDYTYDWSHGETGPYVDDLFADEYTVTATDVNTGCEFLMEFEIEEPDELEYEFELYQPECGVSDQGAVEFFIDGGTWPITFVFEDFDTRDDYIELTPGEFTVTIEDFNGCQLITESFAIVASDAPEAYSSSNGILNCVTDSVGIAIDSSTSGPNISYAWFDPAMNYIGNDSLTIIASAGLYTLQVIDNSNGCISTSTVDVLTNYEVPSVTASSLGNIDCNNLTATLVASGLMPEDTNLVFTWTTLDGVITSDPTATEVMVADAGSYELMVVNTLSGCETISSVLVEAEDVPELEVFGDTEFCEGSFATLCADINADESVEWFRDGDLVSNSDCIDVDISSEYSVVLTNDMTGCQSADIVEFMAYELPEVSVPSQVDICEMETAQICLDGLASDETVVWTRADGSIIDNTICIELSGSESVFATVTNNVTNCSNEQEVEIMENEAPDFQIDGQLEFCEGTFTTLCVDANNARLIWSTDGVELGEFECLTLDVNALVEVEYTDLITGCSSIEVVQTTLSALPDVDIMATGLLDCSNGEVTIELIGEIDAADEVVWYNSSNEMVGNSTALTVDQEGLYLAQMINSAGCVQELTYEVEYDPTDLAVAEFDFTADEFDFTFTNLTEGDYDEVQWDFGDGVISNETNPTHTYADAGFYTVTLTVTNDCGSTTYVVELAAYTELQLTTVSTDVSCFGDSDGRVSVNVFGGIPPYSFEWDDPVNGIGGSDIDGLVSGDYTVVVSDAAGQSVSQTVVIEEPDPIAVSSNIAFDDVTQSGTVELLIEGGTAPYSFMWSNGFTEQNQSGLAVGTYTVDVTDARGCIQTITVVVEMTTSTFEPEILQSFIVSPNPTSDIGRVKISLTESAMTQLTVYSVLGETLYKLNSSGNQISVDLDVQAWDSGLYIIELQTGKKRAVRKLLVSK